MCVSFTENQFNDCNSTENWTISIKSDNKKINNKNKKIGQHIIIVGFYMQIVFYFFLMIVKGFWLAHEFNIVKLVAHLSYVCVPIVTDLSLKCKYVYETHANCRSTILFIELFFIIRHMHKKISLWTQRSFNYIFFSHSELPDALIILPFEN